MDFDVIAIFPEIVEVPLTRTILKRAIDSGLIRVRVHQLRDHADGPHRRVDDQPYGGGGGMVMMPGPIFDAVDVIRARHPNESSRTILLSPQGRRLDHREAVRLSLYGRLILICGRYEGVDERIRIALVDEEMSIGDYVLTGGELAAMVIIDAVSRLIPGVVGEGASVLRDSFADGLLQYPQYTRPAEFRGMPVPDVLLSGRHEDIDTWRQEMALESTKKRRPDLLVDAESVRKARNG
ncbi:MAG TPA: tRNA (guanosine(37)-N1)-methyltransferase TrmD [Candidatus Polarisedimenticolia bacterium]|jgi:tRNA (guanine37-N1)-methyltransferase